MSSPMDCNVKVAVLYGHVELVPTCRFEGNKAVYGGYAIYYDQYGNETHRTEDTPNCVLKF